MNYVFLVLGLGIASASLYVSMFRPPRSIDFRAREQCNNRVRYNMDVTYQDSCPTNRSTYRTYYSPSTRRFSSGGVTPRRNSSTIRGFRGGGPGSGK